MKPKALTLLFFGILTVISFMIGTSAEGSSGTCGTDIQWTFDSGIGTLTITGSGDMQAYEKEEDVPWHAYRSEIRRLYIDDDISSIGNYAFSNCGNLSSINTVLAEHGYLPEALVHIGTKAFWGCSQLKYLVIEQKLATVEDYAFAECSGIIEIYFPDSLERIGVGTFFNCTSLMKVHLGWSSISEIPEKAFYGCESLYRVLYPKTLKKIGAYSFCKGHPDFMALEEHSIEEIGDYAFQYYNSAFPHLPESLKKIGVGIFADSMVIDVTWYSFYSHIPESTFENCKELESVFLYDTLTHIGERAFAGCDALKEVTYTGSKEQYEQIDGIQNETNRLLLEATITYDFIPRQWETETASPAMTVPPTVDTTPSLSNGSSSLLPFYIAIPILSIANAALVGVIIYQKKARKML